MLGKADLRHNIDCHFDMPLNTSRIKFLSSGCAFAELKKSPFAVGNLVMIVASKDRDLLCIATSHT